MGRTTSVRYDHALPEAETKPPEHLPLRRIQRRVRACIGTQRQVETDDRGHADEQLRRDAWLGPALDPTHPRP
jgi:hypothetical protein